MPDAPAHLDPVPGNPIADAYALGFQAGERECVLEVERLRAALLRIVGMDRAGLDGPAMARVAMDALAQERGP